jgi:SAM-dependent methyltransferase
MNAASTRGRDYTGRLAHLEQARWKRVLDVQAPYRWNVRRLLGGREVLDVGCGIGRNLAHLAPHAIGVDHNEHSVAYCRDRGLTAFTSDEFGATEYARPDRFNGLLVGHVVEHMTRAQAVELIASYLVYVAPGGRVVLICPQERGYATDQTHVEYTNFDAFSDICSLLGLEVSRKISFPFPRPIGRVFAHNEFVIVAAKPDQRTVPTASPA